MHTVILVGTSHPIQLGEHSPEQFRRYLRSLIERHHALAIAEEIQRGASTIGSILADELDLKYLYADPNYEQRLAGGISSDLRMDMLDKYSGRYPDIKFWPKHPGSDNLPLEVWRDFSRLTAEAYRLRGGMWLEKLLDFSYWPALFICGANHFSEFGKLLVQNGITVIRESSDWLPN